MISTPRQEKRGWPMTAHSPFLEGSFTPVGEETTAFDLPVTGRLPAGLTGRYLRDGPNPLGLDEPGYRWFLGAGMVHGVRLRDGRAEWYRNRWVRSRAVAESLGEKWPGGPVHADADFAANTHIIRHAAYCSPRSSRPRPCTPAAPDANAAPDAVPNLDNSMS
jgi:carotenoid cleavage dioxygenase